MSAYIESMDQTFMIHNKRINITNNAALKGCTMSSSPNITTAPNSTYDNIIFSSDSHSFASIIWFRSKINFKKYEKLADLNWFHVKRVFFILRFSRYFIILRFTLVNNSNVVFVTFNKTNVNINWTGTTNGVCDVKLKYFKTINDNYKRRVSLLLLLFFFFARIRQLAVTNSTPRKTIKTIQYI